jgi:hypothetical protein
VDPRQRSADRRRFQKIGLAFVVGLMFLGLGAAAAVFDAEGGGRQWHRFSPEVGYVLGAGWIGVAVFDLGRRLLTGPTKPGKRARH